MKIVQVMPRFTFGGAEIMCETLVYELCKLGHDVYVVSLYNQETVIVKRMKERGIRVILLDKRPGPDLTLMSKLRKIFIGIQPDVIHTHLYVMEYVIPASVGLKVKRIHTLHSIASKENNKFGRILNYFFFKTRKVIPIALSGLVQETIENEYNLSEDNVPIIYNGISLEKCMPKSDYKIENKIKLLHIGRFTSAKNHIELLKAIKLLKEKHFQVVLTLVGDGELRKEIEQFVRDNDMGEYVNLYGISDNVYPLLHASDIFLLPSIYEGIPMTLIEAMGTGLPIIASNVGGIPNMISNNVEGILITPTANEIENAIEKLMTKETLRAKYGKAAINKAKEFSSINMAKEYIKVYESSN